MRLPRLRFTVRRLMTLVAVVALFLAGGIWTEEVRQRRKALLEWAKYHEAAERDANDMLWSQPWSRVIVVHRVEAELKVRRLHVEEERQRRVWTPAAMRAAEDYGLRCGTSRLQMEQTISQLRSEGASITEVLPDAESESPGDLPASVVDQKR